jgi:hypothetical protein
VDRTGAPKSSSPGLGRAKTSGYAGDRFQIGKPGQLWVVESARTWVIPEDRVPRDGKVGDFFEKIAFAGGIEIPPPASGEPDCDCHNLLLLQTGIFEPRRDEANTNDIRLTKVSPSLWQIDFRRLSWTVPGGSNLQFGVLGIGRPAGHAEPYRLFSAAARVDTPNHLRAFSEKGKLEGEYTEPGLPPNTAIRVQVWGHLSASISIRRRGDLIDVTLHGTPSFDVRKIRLADLRFGPKRGVPVSTQPQPAGQQMKIVARFRQQDTGIQPGDVNACLSGRQADGVPFEGCALLGRR